MHLLSCGCNNLELTTFWHLRLYPTNLQKTSKPTCSDSRNLKPPAPLHPWNLGHYTNVVLLLLTGICRITMLKILAGITLLDMLSVSEHVWQAINASVHTFHALRILHAHGMDDTAYKMIFQLPSSPSYSMLPLHGVDLRRLTTANVSMVLFDVILEWVYVHQTSHQLLNSLLMLMPNYFIACCTVKCFALSSSRQMRHFHIQS